MTTFAIGDIQGCYQTLQKLLERIHFRPTKDKLLLVGDLVNRGPDSLSVLRWAKSLGDKNVVSVLGNHDLHLLSIYLGVKRPHKDKKDTLKSILNAPDCDELMQWLRNRPLLHKEGKFLLVHAGILPAWSTKEALINAEIAEHYLRGSRAHELLTLWNSTAGSRWQKSLSNLEKAAVTLNVFTRMRACTSLKSMDLKFSGPPKEAPAGLKAWYKIPNRESRKQRVIFGHWAALGYKNNKEVIALDTGCVWGGQLTCYSLEDDKKHSVKSIEKL